MPKIPFHVTLLPGNPSTENNPAWIHERSGDWPFGPERSASNPSSAVTSCDKNGSVNAIRVGSAGSDGGDLLADDGDDAIAARSIADGGDLFADGGDLFVQNDCESIEHVLGLIIDEPTGDAVVESSRSSFPWLCAPVSDFITCLFQSRSPWKGSKIVPQTASSFGLGPSSENTANV